METKQAYEFTLDTIGQDIHSGAGWLLLLLVLADAWEGRSA